MAIFSNRIEAGKRLAAELMDYSGKDPIILAIPRGGVIIGYEVAQKLKAPLDIIVPRKIGAPHNPELAIGAVTEDGTTILDNDLIERLGVSQNYIRGAIERQRLEIQRRVRQYREEAPYPKLKDRNVILVDDGIATGATIRAALASIRTKEPKSIVIAVPVAPPATVQALKKEGDQVICLHTPWAFYAIGQFYDEFSQTSDREVLRLLKLNKKMHTLGSEYSRNVDQ